MNDDPTAALRPELLDDFYLEADELLEQIRTQLSLLENAPGAAPDPAGVETLFRSMHSLKGISAMAGLRAAEELAHAAEDFLRRLTRGGARLTPPALEMLISAARRLEEIVGAHRLSQPAPAVADLCREFTLLSAAGEAGGDPLPAPPPAGGPAASALESLQARGLLPWRCTFQPSRELDERGVNINAVRARLSALGQIAGATPSVRAGGTIAFEFLVGLREAPADADAWARDGVVFEPLEQKPAPATALAERAADAVLARRDRLWGGAGGGGRRGGVGG